MPVFSEVYSLFFLRLTKVSAMDLGTNFGDIAWGIHVDISKEDAVLAVGENPWNPTLLMELAFSESLHTMDWTPTNNVDNVSGDLIEVMPSTDLTQIFGIR